MVVGIQGEWLFAYLAHPALQKTEDAGTQRPVNKTIPSRPTQLRVSPDSFGELEKHKSWWMVASGEEVDLCTENPGREVDLYINTSVRALVEVWHGDVGLARSMKQWLGISPVAGN